MSGQGSPPLRSAFPAIVSRFVFVVKVNTNRTITTKIHFTFSLRCCIFYVLGESLFLKNLYLCFNKNASALNFSSFLCVETTDTLI